MGYQESSAFHIYRFDYSETSQIATFFTRDRGKITAIAKGARREKNDFDGPIDLLVRSNIRWIQRPPNRLSILTKCDQQDTLRALRLDRRRLIYGFWVIFVLNRLTASGQSNRALFDHARKFTMHLKQTEQVRRGCLYFDLFALRHLGHLPKLDMCVLCERPVGDVDRIFFSFHAGGVLCDRCSKKRSRGSSAEQGRNVLPAEHTTLLSPSRGTVRALNAVLRLRTPFETSETVELSDRQLGEARRLLNHCYRYLLGYDPELLSVL